MVNTYCTGTGVLCVGVVEHGVLHVRLRVRLNVGWSYFALNWIRLCLLPQSSAEPLSLSELRFYLNLLVTSPSPFESNSEASASELLGNIEEICPRYLYKVVDRSSCTRNARELSTNSTFSKLLEPAYLPALSQLHTAILRNINVNSLKLKTGNGVVRG